MTLQSTRVALIVMAAATFFSVQLHAAPPDLAPLLQKIRAVEGEGKGNREATAAWQELAKADVAQLPEILKGMDGAGPIATNWLRGAFDSIAERTHKAGGKLPVAELKKYLADTSHSPRGRRIAFEWIIRDDPTQADLLVPGFLNDPSLELRREAVARKLDEAAKLTDKPAAVAAHKELFSAARDFDQVVAAAKKLKEFGESPDIAAEFGFLRHWWVVAPFDNTNRTGFDVAYPPEKSIDLKAEYTGKGDAKATWKEYTLPEQPGELEAAKIGNVDLNEVLAKHKGAIAYAYTEFNAEKECDVEFRLGCITGNKLWLNGRFVSSNNVYHSNTEMDQYIARGRLKAGKNTILLKIAQNEQTEPWAQNWHFQFRITDALGTPIRAAK